MIRIAAVVAVFLLAAPAAATAGGPTILTIAGAVGETNRGPVDPFADAFMAFSDVDFEAAFAFDRSTLAALEQATVTANAEGWPNAIEATGPRLDDVLSAAGVSDGATVTVVALDGYAAEITAEMRADTTWIVAIEAGGVPLGIGGRGPAWVLPDTDGNTVPEDGTAAWVWSAYLITVE